MSGEETKTNANETGISSLSLGGKSPNLPPATPKSTTLSPVTTAMVTPSVSSTVPAPLTSTTLPDTVIAPTSAPFELLPQLNSDAEVDDFFRQEEVDKDESEEPSALLEIAPFGSSQAPFLGELTTNQIATVDVKTLHATRQPLLGKRCVLQVKGNGEFNKPETVDGYGNAQVFTAGNECGGRFVMPVLTPSSPKAISDVLDMLATQMYSVPMTPEIRGLFKSVFGVHGPLLHLSQTGVPGVSGRNRFEGVLRESELIRQLLNFMRSHQRFQFVTSALPFEYYSKAELNSLIQKAESLPSTVPHNLSVNISTSLAVIKEAASVPRCILPHGDYPAKKGVRMMKAIFSFNTSNEDSFWDFYLNDGTFVCTVKIPSGSCLFISDFALGMLNVRRRI